MTRDQRLAVAAAIDALERIAADLAAAPERAKGYVPARLAPGDGDGYAIRTGALEEVCASRGREIRAVHDVLAVAFRPRSRTRGY